MLTRVFRRSIIMAAATAERGVKRKASDTALTFMSDPWFEPTEAEKDMTVEEFLRSRVDKMEQDYRASCARHTKRLRQMFAENSAEIVEAVKSLQQEGSENSLPMATPVRKTRSSRLKKTPGSTRKTKGCYVGTTFALELKSRRLCRLGRSTGKTFTSNGISLPNDVEVSTTHGKFGLKGGEPYYTDVGSSNGSLLNGEELAANKSRVLSNGDVLTVGSTELVVQIVNAAADEK